MEHDAVALNQYLSTSEQAIKAKDSEFAIKICKNAANFISDPRILLVTGKAHKEKGELVDAICCFRAALTMDTGVSGNAPADAQVSEASGLLASCASELGLKAGSWTIGGRKKSAVTASQLEQLIKNDQVDRAMELYRETPEYQNKRNADFHVQVGKALRAVPGQRNEAIHAFMRSAQCGTGKEALGYYEVGDTHYEAREYEEAMRWYDKALAEDKGMALAISGKANCRKDQGRLEDAVALYTEAMRVSPTDPTFVFNLAQAYEYVQEYHKAIACIEAFNASLMPGDMTTVNHFAIPLLQVKLLFVAGEEYAAKTQGVIKQIKGYPAVAKEAVMKLSTHWAYYYFLSHLLEGDAICSSLSEAEPFYIVGDSHVLSSSWRDMTVQGRKCVAVPKLVTGLKAWHMREGFEFLTVSNLRTCMESIPARGDGTKGTALFVCGEIDCREGLPNALAKNRFETMERGVSDTVGHYLAGIARLEEQHKIKLLILSVCPPTNPSYTQRILATRLFNAELKKRLPREKFVDVSGHVTSSEGVVKQIYACDGTHLNRKAAELIEDGISACLA